MEKRVVNVSIENVNDYSKSFIRRNMKMAMSLDMTYLTERAIQKADEDEKVLLLADFLLNYTGDNFHAHMFNFVYMAPRAFDGKVCDVSLVSLARFNSSIMADNFLIYAGENNNVEDNENLVLVEEVASFFELGHSAKSYSQDGISYVKK